jgi:3-oxoacyl-[acyl-carrier-protein] synthase I
MGQTAHLSSLAITAFAMANALGHGSAATRQALLGRRSGLRRNDLPSVDLETWIGRVEGLEERPVDAPLAAFDCRNNRLAQLALRQDDFETALARARARYGAHRVAVVIGTSTSGIHETELAYAARDPISGALPPTFQYAQTHNVHSAAQFVQSYLALDGPSLAISTACSSSAKVFSSAYRLIAAGYADAAVVGGVDSLCYTTLYGFNALELLSRDACRPCDVERNGISIGEAAGYVLLERGEAAFTLAGYGESSDAHHMSTPHPEGEGAYAAMREALDRAGIEASAVGYVNMHGTATRANDRAEDHALFTLFGDSVPCSSTKGWTGHTLGAAGITEAIISLMCLEQDYVPGSLNTRRLDPELRSRIAVESEPRKLRYVLSNSFGFGGNNCSLLFEKHG